MYSNFPILIAEDDPHDRFLVKRAFLKAGINAPLHFAEDGRMAEEHLTAAAKPDGNPDIPMPKLVLLDIKMPGVDGLQVLYWIRQRKDFKCLPVVMFTSSGMPRDVDGAYRMGANAYIVKPGTASELVNLVKDIEAFWLRRNRYPNIPE